MKNQILVKAMEVASNVGKTHGSTILTGLAVVGVLATAIFSAMARPKADEAIEEAEAKKADDEMEAAEREGRELKDISQIGKLTFWEKVKASWKCYILTVITGVLTVACIVGGHVISLRKIGDLAATCNVLQMANDRYEKYAEKVKEEIGEEKHEELKTKADEEIRKDQVSKHPSLIQNAILTGDGEVLFWDPYGVGYIRTSQAALDRAANKITLNALKVKGFPIATMEDFYMEINIPVEKIPKRADRLMWYVEEHVVEMCCHDSGISESGEPYVIMEFKVEPDIKGVTGERHW